MTNTTTHRPTDLLSCAVQGAAFAQEYIDRYANEAGRANYRDLAARGRLELHVGLDPDGHLWGQYFDADRLQCWDGCDGVLTFHRAGWCPFVAEHADFDCMCGGGYDDDDDYPEERDPDFNEPDEPDYEGLAYAMFDEDEAIRQAEARYEAALDRMAEPF